MEKTVGGHIRPYESELNILKHAIDGVLLVLVLVLACWLYLDAWEKKYTIVAISGVALFYVAAKINNLYLSSRYRRVSQEITPLLYSWFTAFAGLLFLGYAFKLTQDYSRIVLGLWFLGAPLFLILWRALLKSGLNYGRRMGYNTRSVVIVGTGKSAQRLASNIQGMSWIGLNLLGFISESGPCHNNQQQDDNSKLLGGLKTLYQMKAEGKVDVVYIALPADQHQQIDEILEVLSDSTVSTFLVPDFDHYGIAQGRWITIGDTPTVSVAETPMLGSSAGLKRLEDLFVAALAIIITAPLMAIIALAIKLDSKGPVLYKQRRHGLNGQEIYVWKFRSMKCADKDSPFKQACKGDQRITRIGKLLRCTSLDELPQFFNVLAGHMSVVGPRPHALAHNEEYRGSIWGYMQRHKVKPGITGLAQINGYRGETDTQEKMEQRFKYDMEYLNNWSIWLDLKIIILTPLAVISAKNAY
jgi:putative colanic acid biosynthesis UDP-glucose lipid carrier transferase